MTHDGRLALSINYLSLNHLSSTSTSTLLHVDVNERCFDCTLLLLSSPILCRRCLPFQNLIDQNLNLTKNKRKYRRRKAALDVFRLRSADSRPVLAAGSARPRLAHRVPQVLRVRHAHGRDVHVLCARRQDILQARLHPLVQQTLRQVPRAVRQERPRHSHPSGVLLAIVVVVVTTRQHRPHLSSRLLLLRRLQQAAQRRRRVRHSARSSRRHSSSSSSNIIVGSQQSRRTLQARQRHLRPTVASPSTTAATAAPHVGHKHLSKHHQRSTAALPQPSSTTTTTFTESSVESASNREQSNPESKSTFARIPTSSSPSSQSSATSATSTTHARQVDAHIWHRLAGESGRELSLTN